MARLPAPPPRDQVNLGSTGRTLTLTHADPMSNNAYLLNTPQRSSDIAALSGRWLVVADMRNRIPLPWLCLFDEADLRPCTITFNHSKVVGGEQRQLLGKFSILNPSTSVKAAKNNLAKARHVFEALAGGDTAAAQRHWTEALAALDELPLGYLTIDPTEILLMGDLKAGAAAFASAISSRDGALDAKRQVAGIEANASAKENFGGLNMGFLSSAWFHQQERSVEDTRSHLERLARLDTCNLARTETGYETLPLDLNRLNPPDAFWEDAALVEAGDRHLRLSHGESVWKDGKNCYATRLANISGKKVRVRMFAGFARVQGGYALANYTKQWFTAQNFIAWYGVANDGWIQPGTTVADNNNWGGNEDGFWAYWCETEDQAQFVAIIRNPPLPAPGSPQVSSASGPWAPLLDEHRAAIRTNLGVCQRLAHDLAGKHIDFDEKAVQWLDDLLEQLHRRTESTNGHAAVPAYASYLGECIIRNIGGEWALHDGTICVRFDNDDAVFPLNKVKKQLANGKEGGDSVLGLYQALLAMRPQPLTSRQQRLLSLYRQRSGDHQFFVLNQNGGAPEWARVRKMDETWVGIETALTAGLRSPPEVSVRLDRVADFYVTDPAGARVDPDALAHAPAAGDDTSPGNARPKNWLRQTVPHPADPAMADLIHRLRSTFANRQKSLNPLTLGSVRAPCPAWMPANEALREILNRQDLLLTQGRIVWAALIQANKLMFSPGKDDCPALLLYSHDPYFDARPHELRSMASSVFKLKNTAPANPEEKAVADLITDEMDRSMGWKLPDAVTDKDACTATFLVFRKHIPNGVLSAGSFPILTHPSTPATMVLPFEFWPIELIVLWKEGKL
jgi:hypothetical protein